MFQCSKCGENIYPTTIRQVIRLDPYSPFYTICNKCQMEIVTEYVSVHLSGKQPGDGKGCVIMQSRKESNRNRLATFTRYEEMAEILERNLASLDLPQHYHDLLAAIKHYLEVERPFVEAYRSRREKILRGPLED